MEDKKKQSVVFSIRIQGACTSISIRKNILALWALFLEIEDWKSSLNDFAYQCADKWKGRSAKGFSDFVTSELIVSLLEEKDSVLYKKILVKL